ncbi:hypothetical protein RintRC_7283 [Richelia intracellularis]|nr:hypothetical protein RintRC_7283 [Richelia intracellularis]
MLFLFPDFGVNKGEICYKIKASENRNNNYRWKFYCDENHEHQ